MVPKTYGKYFRRTETQAGKRSHVFSRVGGGGGRRWFPEHFNASLVQVSTWVQVLEFILSESINVLVGPQLKCIGNCSVIFLTAMKEFPKFNLCRCSISGPCTHNNIESIFWTIYISPTRSILPFNIIAKYKVNKHSST